MAKHAPDIAHVLGCDTASEQGRRRRGALLGNVVGARHVGADAHAVHAVRQQPVQRLHCTVI